MSDIMVSVHCLAYNHEKCLTDALEGFLMQKTNFAYEILIHDDASTDGTTYIIRDYERRYPDIIKPIYQTENQHSKGVRLTALNTSRAKGKYIASCEGDDFWTDPNKLQKQFDYMEAHPECSMCVHASWRVTFDKRELKNHIRPNIGNKIINIEDILMFKDKGYVQTSSFFYRKDLIKELPHFYYIAPVGDYPLIIHLALKGSIYYIDEFMSAYRCNTPGSWSNTILRNEKKYSDHVEKIELMLDEVNKYTGYKYINIVEEAKNYHHFYKELNAKKYKELKLKKYRKFFLELDGKTRFKINLYAYFPMISKLLSCSLLVILLFLR